MTRRVWIIPKDKKVDEKVVEEATLNGCAEIAWGIPPSLEKIVTPPLPRVYIEPDTIIESSKPIEIETLTIKVENLEARIKALESTGVKNGQILP